MRARVPFSGLEASLGGQRTIEKAGRRLCAVPLFSVPDQLALQLSAARPHPHPWGSRETDPSGNILQTL